MCTCISDGCKLKEKVKTPVVPMELYIRSSQVTVNTVTTAFDAH